MRSNNTSIVDILVEWIICKTDKLSMALSIAWAKPIKSYKLLWVVTTQQLCQLEQIMAKHFDTQINRCLVCHKYLHRYNAVKTHKAQVLKRAVAIRRKKTTHCCYQIGAWTYWTENRGLFDAFDTGNNRKIAKKAASCSPLHGSHGHLPQLITIPFSSI